jgi:folate-dependent tRNA-U54 methylase TrmFO/GidA
MSGVGARKVAASGLLAGINAAARNRARVRAAATTAIGAGVLCVACQPAHYEPSNITFGIMEPMDARQGQARPESSGGKTARQLSKLEKKLAIANRALEDLSVWMQQAAA